MLRILQSRRQQLVNCELADGQAGFRKGRGIREQIASIHWLIGKTEFQKNIYFCFTDYVKAFDCVHHNKLWKVLQEVRIPDHLICLLRNLYASQKATVRTGTVLMEKQQTGSKSGKEYVKTVYCHPAYLTYMQNTSGKMLGWMKHKLESRLLEEILRTSNTQMIPSLWQQVEN